MKSLPKHTRLILIVSSLLLFVILTGLSLPVKSAVLQTAPSPTPTPTIVYVNGEPVLQSGDTEGLILGAGVILLIILSGVIIQRAILRKTAPGSH
ncbi:MAG: hypothetical protein ACK2TT_12040 [Anaerolineales bacterium]|jgi:hypothetical protein